MPAERKPGSNRGRPAIDWQAAYLFYAGLPADQRSYQAVADQFQVSVRTVERHGRNKLWKQRAQQLDQAAATAAAERLRDHRAEKLVDMEKLIDASCVTYATQLRDGKVRVSPADLPRLHKLRTELWNDSDTQTADNEQPDTAVDATDPTERKLQVLAALRDAGVLQQLLANDELDHADAGEPKAHADQPDEQKQHDDGDDDTDQREVA